MNYCLSAEQMLTNCWRVVRAHTGQHHGTLESHLLQSSSAGGMVAHSRSRFYKSMCVSVWFQTHLHLLLHVNWNYMCFRNCNHNGDPWQIFMIRFSVAAYSLWNQRNHHAGCLVYVGLKWPPAMSAFDRQLVVRVFFIFFWEWFWQNRCSFILV